ncbi:M12 family metallopeptidase [Arcticibacter tournemirensis]|uniref:Peptidase M12 n=1 Tax=Arcticibacter tournemirensis TaxID=699437 RepID=A0A4Q0M7Q3_9SPHI|nr:M12 family metallopeptidase [Arcticibacter tournemirensis]RXF68829.1 peptidase M12 [Arcticibacter tournemirensis]
MMYKRCLIILTLATMMFSCKKDQMQSDIPTTSDTSAVDALESEMAATRSDEENETDFESDARTPRVCVDRLTDSDPIILDERDDVNERAVLRKGTKWANGKTLKVFFMNGSSYLRNKVITYARRWANHANLHFVVTNNKAESDIRVGFKINRDRGSWSYLGKDADRYRKGKQTMNFGWFNRKTEESELRRTIIHEFGHAIGLAHEHLSPVSTINWDKPKVYDYYMGPPNNWTRKQVDDNVLNRYKPRDVRNTKYDPLSIMHYPVDPALTTDGQAVGENTTLSDKDKNFIKRIYPN